MADTAMSYFVEHGLRVNLGLPNWLGNCLVEQGPFQRLISWLSPLALPMEVPFFWFWTHLPPHLRYFILITKDPSHIMPRDNPQLVLTLGCLLGSTTGRGEGAEPGQRILPVKGLQ